MPELTEVDGDVSLTPRANADSETEIRQCISPDVFEKYDVYSYRHAATIFKHTFPVELTEIENALRRFSITKDDIAEGGGNESRIPKKFSTLLRPLDWNETRIQGNLIINVHEQSEEILTDGKLKKHTLPTRASITLENYIDGHKIDYVKGSVALDMEWNSKDQTFDRDLYAFRIFHECGFISAAALITRSEKLNEIFHQLPQKDEYGNVKLDKKGKTVYCISKYGASTTWMGKLLYRMNAGRHGGCPVLIFGIRPEAVSDWP